MSLTTESKMSNENDGWETIEVSEDKKEVDFEIEEEEQPKLAQENECRRRRRAWRRPA